MLDQSTPAVVESRGHEHQWVLSTVDYDEGGLSVSQFDCTCGDVTFR